MVDFPLYRAGFAPFCTRLLAALLLACTMPGPGAGAQAAAAAPGRPAAAAAKPADPGSDASDLRLEAGDTVELSMVGRPELTIKTKVSDEGNLDVPLAGSVPVLGASLATAAERVATAYREGEFFIDPEVHITLAVPRPEQIGVGGEVVHPGVVTLVRNLSVKDAVALVGGVTPRAAEVAYILRRSVAGSAPVRIEVDLVNAGFALNSQNVILLAGDRLEVPPSPRFEVQGAVRNPASYSLRRGMTVSQAIEAAGGLNGRGSSRRVAILRKDATGTVRELDADTGNVVQANDVIRVKERLF